MKARALVIAFGVVASLISCSSMPMFYRGAIDVFHLADPTGSWGLYFNVGGLAATLAILFVAACLFLRKTPSRFVTWCAIAVFTPPVLAGIAILPCYLASRPSALCGVGSIIVWTAAIPWVLVGAIAFASSSKSRAIQVTGIATAVAFFSVAGIAHKVVTPSDPNQCQNFEVTKKAACLNSFAQRRSDENLCRAIEFRSTRFTCLREVALKKGQAQLCGEIRDNAPIQSFEPPAAFYRDACFQSMAYSHHDRNQCAKVEDPQLRVNCEKNVH